MKGAQRRSRPLLRQSVLIIEQEPPCHVFIKHPLVRGVWLRTHVCVLTVRCPWCKRPPGEPCYGPMGSPVGSAHADRKDAHYSKEKRVRRRKK